MEWRPSYCKYCGEEVSKKRVEGKERFYCESCDRVLWQSVPSTAGALVERNGKVLVVKRGIDPWKGKWSLPAGYMDRGEKPKETASRETEEETGMKVEPEDLEHFENISLRHPNGKDVLVTVYRARKTSGEIEPGPEVKDAEFRDPGKLEKTPLLQKILGTKENE